MVLGEVVVEDVELWSGTLRVLEVLEVLKVLEVLEGEELGPEVPGVLENERLGLEAPAPVVEVVEVVGVGAGGAAMFDRSSVRRKIEL